MTTNKANKVSKTTTAKTAAKPAVKPVAKPAVKTTAAPAKEEPKKEAVKPVAEEEKPVAKTTAAKTARKTTRKPRKTSKATIRKTAATVDSEVFVQIYGQEFSQQEIMEKVVAAWEAEGKKITSIKRAKLYVKPEEGKAYYVVNEGLKNGSTGAVDLYRLQKGIQRVTRRDNASRYSLIPRWIFLFHSGNRGNICDDS